MCVCVCVFHSPDGDTDFFDIFDGVLQRDASTTDMFIIDKSNKRKWFHTKKAISRQYTTETIIKADYTNDIVLLKNTPTQAESLQLSLEQAA